MQRGQFQKMSFYAFILCVNPDLAKDVQCILEFLAVHCIGLLNLSFLYIPSKLLQKELYVAFPVTAPSLAGFCLTVFTVNPSGPVTSTSTIW